jgi:hypothetical protein
MGTVVIISVGLFVAYVAAVICLFGIPASISESFYLLEKKRKGLGYLFSGWCWAMAVPVTAMTMQQSGGQWWQFVSLFAGGGLGFVGTAPLFKGHERTVHYVSAGVCALSALAWMTLAGYVFVPVIILSGLLLLGLLHGEKWLFWVETALFVSMYIVLFFEVWKN